MTETSRSPVTSRPYSSSLDRTPAGPAPANLADILERVLDKGIIIAGDIKVNLLDIELLTIKIRLLIVSVDKAAERAPCLGPEASDSDEGRPHGCFPTAGADRT